MSGTRENKPNTRAELSSDDLFIRPSAKEKRKTNILGIRKKILTLKSTDFICVFRKKGKAYYLGCLKVD